MSRPPPISTLFPYTTLFRSRYSELAAELEVVTEGMLSHRLKELERAAVVQRRVIDEQPIRVEYHLDRKSTRLNSSHTVISYAVFCLKKKKKNKKYNVHNQHL